MKKFKVIFPGSLEVEPVELTVIADDLDGAQMRATVWGLSYNSHAEAEGKHKTFIIDGEVYSLGEDEIE